MRIRWVDSTRFVGSLRWPALFAGAWLALVALAVAIASRAGQPLELCLWKRVTGIPCLTCGSGRGVLELLAGNVSAALAHNPLFFLLMGWVVAGAVLRALLRRRLAVCASHAERRMLWGLVAVAVLVQWTYLVRVGA